MTHETPQIQFLLAALSRALGSMQKAAPRAGRPNRDIDESECLPISQQQHDQLYSAVARCLQGEPDLERAAPRLKQLLDYQMTKSISLGITAQEDLYAELLGRWAAEVKNPPKKAQQGFASVLDMHSMAGECSARMGALNAYYHTGFTALIALQDLTHKCLPESRGLSVHALAKGRADGAEPIVGMTPEGMILTEVECIKAETLDAMFFDHLVQPPARRDMNGIIPMHCFLAIARAWHVAAEQVRSNEHITDRTQFTRAVASVVRPTLQRLYDSGKWQCTSFADVHESMRLVMGDTHAGKAEQRTASAINRTLH